MGERTPLDYRYGRDQGRLQPPFVPRSGDYTFVLGAESPHVRHLRTSDSVEIYQDLDLTDIKHVRFDAAILQPSAMPRPRDVAGGGSPYVHTASLKYQEVLPIAQPTFHPSVLAGAHELYQLPAIGSTLLISVDGGTPQTVAFPTGGDWTAAQVASKINDDTFGLTASPGGAADDPQLLLASDATGRNASLRIIGGSAYALFEFPLGPLVRYVAGHSSDSLTATLGSTGFAHLENGAFTSPDDVGRVLKVRGSILPNNKDYIITAVAGPKDVTITPSPASSQSGSFLSAATFDGIYETRTFYGGDDLSAIIAPDGHFTEADSGLPIKIYNAANPLNNFINFIVSVQSPEVAVLRYAVVDEGPGFDALVVGAEWQFSVFVDVETQYAITPERGRPLYTHDIAVNVSKLTGTHRIGFRLELLPDVTI